MEVAKRELISTDSENQKTISRGSVLSLMTKSNDRSADAVISDV